MAIKRCVLALILLPSLCFSQNIDSLNAVYRKYYETIFLTNSPSGQYVVLNHNNTYGKNEDELFDVKNGKGIALDKHRNYQFLDDSYLLMQNMEYNRIKDLKTGQYRDIIGNFTYPATITKEGQILLHSVISGELVLTSKDGQILWKISNISNFQFDGKNNRLIYTSGKQLVIRDLNNQQVKNYQLDSDSQWLAIQGDRIYCANIKATQLELCTLDVLTGQMVKKTINSPEAFEFAKALSIYFEIREGRHFLFPLYLKSKLNYKQDPELKITYSNRNGKNEVLNRHLGIFNLEEGKWDYEPDAKQKLPIYKFLNDKGDFVVYDQSGDVVEEQQNVILDLNLILDYGKGSYLLPKKRIVDGNYLWDRGSEQFIYFEHKRWRCHHIKTGVDHELLPEDTRGWHAYRFHKGNSGLAEEPEVNPVHVKNRPAVILSNQFDYFMVDLKTHQLQRITKGEEQNIKYELQLAKEQYPKSFWNIRLAEIDLDKEMKFKLFNLKTYDSRFATYLHQKNKTNLYKQGHYKEMIAYNNGHFLISYFALEPFQLTKFENGKYTILYESLTAAKKDFEGAKYQIFQYQTRYGTDNAALLFPVGYDPKKKYPMIVNIYENKSRELLPYLSPFLEVREGFHYMHYLMNGYIVLLPDLQYEIGNVKNSVITSLETCIDTAKLFASIDDRNIGVVGLSYGGYETGLALTNSKYFKTGVAGVMLADMVSFALSKTDVNSEPNYMRVENKQARMGTSVFGDWNRYLENSPIYYMKNVDAPVLLWTGLKDKNVPPTQTKMFFLGMKRLKKKAVLLEYVNETHNVFLPKNKLDLNLKTWQWFEHYLKNKLPAEWMAPIVNN